MKRTIDVGLAAVGLAAVLIGGCAANKKQMNGSAVPPTGEQVEAIRASYKSAFPNAVVGIVTAVLDDKPYALVNQIDPAAVHERQVITFLDGQQKVIANGTVAKADDTGVTVRFEAGARRPMAGDIAVRF